MLLTAVLATLAGGRRAAALAGKLAMHFRADAPVRRIDHCKLIIAPMINAGAPPIFWVNAGQR